MDLIEGLFLVFVILLGIIASYTDIKFGKIRNKYIIIFGIGGILLNLIIFLSYYLSGILNWSYVFEFFINLILAFLVSFLFYYFDIWSAGDGKLFGVFAILVPLSIYSVGHVKFFPALTLLINIFLIAFLVMIFSLVINIFKKGISIKNLGKNIFSGIHKKLFISAVQIFIILWAINLFFGLLNIKPNFYLRFILILILFGSLRTFLLKYTKILLAVAGIRLVFDWSIYSWGFLSEFLIYILFFRFFMDIGFGLLDHFSTLFFSKTVNARKLKEGDVSSDVIVMKDKLDKKTKDNLKKEDIEFVRFIGKYYIKYPKAKATEKSMFDSAALSREDVKLLKKIGFKKHSVNEKIPFAIFIFFGTLITYFIKGTLISFILSLL